MNIKQQILNDLGKPFDVFLVCAMKDVVKLPFVVKSVIRHVVNLNKIYICTPKPIDKLDIDYPIEYYTDKKVLNIDPYMWKFRPNWIYQQMLKLFQNITETNFYLTVDCDNIFVKDIRFFNEKNRPVWYKGWDQNNQQYYNFNSTMFNLNKTVNHTFIADMNFFNKTVIQYMLETHNMTVKSFLNKSFDITNITCHISEAELYGQFVSKYLPGMYEIKNLKQFNNGKHNDNPNAVIWNKNEINETLNKYVSGDYDVIQFHTWCLGVSNDWQ